MSVVVIGAGQAGLQTIMSLRQGGYEGDITTSVMKLICPISARPCQKPICPAKWNASKLFPKPDDFYSDNNVTLKLMAEVAALMQLQNRRTEQWRDAGL